MLGYKATDRNTNLLAASCLSVVGRCRRRRWRQRQQWQQQEWQQQWWWSSFL